MNRRNLLQGIAATGVTAGLAPRLSLVAFEVLVAAAQAPADRRLPAARLDDVTGAAQQPAQERQAKGEQEPEPEAAGEEGPDHGTFPLGL